VLPTIQLGAWNVSTYSLMAVLALLAGGMYSTHRLLRAKAAPHAALAGLMATILGGLALTLLAHQLANAVLSALYGPQAPHENLRFIWALAGGAAAAALYCWKRRLPLGRALDVGAALPVPLGLAISRLGCAAAGCCYGKQTDSWLAMSLPDETGAWAMRYPTQLMSAAANLLTFLFLLAVERRTSRRGRGWPFDGFLTLLFLALYSLKRILIGMLRESGPPLWGPFTWMELAALATLAASAGLIAWNLLARRRAQPAAAA